MDARQGKKVVAGAVLLKLRGKGGRSLREDQRETGSSDSSRCLEFEPEGNTECMD